MNKLSTMRRTAKLKIDEAASALKIKPRRLRSYEFGERKLPGVLIEPMADLYEVTEKEIISAAYSREDT